MGEKELMDEFDDMNIDTGIDAESYVEIEHDDEVLDIEALARETLNLDAESVNVDVLKLLLSRLAQILAQEADMLENMEISKLGSVQKEKKALVAALEKQKKLIGRRGQFLKSLEPEEEEELRELVDIFESILKENHKRLLIAKEVNAKVVEAIAELANEQAQKSFYTPQGERAGDPSVSVSLNRSI